MKPLKVKCEMGYVTTLGEKTADLLVCLTSKKLMVNIRTIKIKNKIWVSPLKTIHILQYLVHYQFF